MWLHASYALFIASSRLEPNAVTPRTRPPLDFILSSCFFVPAWKTNASEEIFSNPLISSPVGYDDGYPLDARTTHTEYWFFQEISGNSFSFPSYDAWR